MFSHKIMFLIILTEMSCMFYTTLAYKPVFIIHGILSGDISMLKLAQKIQKNHPGTRVYVSENFCYVSSLDAMFEQVTTVGAHLLQISALHPEGFHLIGYSQGALLARAILQYFSFHRVHTFISLSGPQAGEYGSAFLHLLFKHMVKEEAYELFYSKLGQDISIANYWNDPHHQDLYYKYNKFLPFINNEIKSAFNDSLKYGITKLKQMVLIGGPDDGVITPWQSSQFGYFDENENIVNMKNSSIYKEDLFGLHTLDKSGRLHVITVSGVKHHYWHRNRTVFKDHILPWLI